MTLQGGFFFYFLHFMSEKHDCKRTSDDFPFVLPALIIMWRTSGKCSAGVEAFVVDELFIEMKPFANESGCSSSQTAFWHIKWANWKRGKGCLKTGLAILSFTTLNQNERACFCKCPFLIFPTFLPANLLSTIFTLTQSSSTTLSRTPVSFGFPACLCFCSSLG